MGHEGDCGSALLRLRRRALELSSSGGSSAALPGFSTGAFLPPASRCGCLAACAAALSPELREQRVAVAETWAPLMQLVCASPL